MASQYPDLGPFGWNPVTEDLTIRGGPFTTPDILIAGSNAPDSVKRAAFKVCEGHDDQDVIYEAIRQLYDVNLFGPGEGGLQGQIFLQGSFNFSAPLECPNFYRVTIRATGHSTRINYNNTDPVIVVLNPGWVIEYLETDAGGITLGINGTESIIRYWKDGEWTEVISAPTAVQIACFPITWGVPTFDTPYIPQYSVVNRVDLLVTEAFNSDGTDEIEVGFGTDHDGLALPVDVSTTGPKILLAGTYLGTMLDYTFLNAAYTAGGSAATAGRAIVTVYYYTTRG
jgi:hypothetical protein